MAASASWAFVLFWFTWPLNAAQVLVFVAIALGAFLFAKLVWKGELKARFKLDLFYIAGMVVLLALAMIANRGVVLKEAKQELIQNSPF